MAEVTKIAWTHHSPVDRGREAISPVIGRRPLPMFSDNHGGIMEEWPAELRVRQCPENFVPQYSEATC